MDSLTETLALALRHHQAGRLAEAEPLYRQVLAAQPRHVDALHYLGLLAHHAGRHDVAVDLIRRAVALAPNDPDAHCNLGEAYRATGQLDEALASHRRAIALEPHHAEAWDNLGIALAEQGNLPEAIAAHECALRIKPSHAPAHNNRGAALVEIGRLDDAIAAFRQALALKPDYSDAKFNQSLALLLQGEYTRAWPLYEARFDDPAWPRRNLSQPRWNSGSVEGRRVLIHAEQGFGDAIQFIRYARLLADRGATVLVECPPTLARLFRTAPGVSNVIAAGDPLPAFDLHVPMLSLPLLFQTKPETIPRETPYLFPDKDLSEIWASRLGERSPRLKVGLAWSGRSENSRLRKRHIDFEMLHPLLEVKGVDFFTLQTDVSSGAIQRSPSSPHLVDLTHQIDDFADTAALVAHLDLVISVDTAVAHLAAALGRPVWTLLPFAPDWRWGLNSEESAWYPTMRLFRQPSLGDWPSVLPRVTAELKLLAPK